MGNEQFTVNNAISIQLALDTDGLILCEEQVRGKMQTLLSDVHDFTKGRGVVFRDQAPSGHRHTKLLALHRHQFTGSI